MENREMNLFDFIRLCWHALVRFFKRIGVIVLETVRLCIQYIWIVLPCTMIGILGGWLWTKDWATTFKGNATIVYAEGMRDVVNEGIISFMNLKGDVKEEEYGLEKAYQKSIGKFERLNVIDAYHFDSVPDYVDRAREIAPKDTMNLIMKDRTHLVVELKGSKDFMPLQNALEKYFNETEYILLADKRCKEVRASRLAHFEKEYARLDSFSSYDYFQRPRYLGAEWGNHIISERDQKLYYEDMMVVARHKEYLEGQVLETPNVINFQTPFVPYSMPPLWKYIIGLMLGGLIGIAISLLVKYWKGVLEYMKQK